MNPAPIKRKARESSQFYEREPKFQFLISEYQIRVSNSSNSEVWRYFGDLFHNGMMVCDRVYCSPCFEKQKVDGLNYTTTFGALMPRIKHYAKSVSTGNLAIHLHDKHNIEIGNSSQCRSIRSHRRRPGRTLDNANPLMNGEDQSTQSSNSSSFANIDSADEFDEDQEPSVIAKTIQKLAVEIVGRISTTDSLTNLIHEFRSLLRLSRSNFVCLMKTKGYAYAEAHHNYSVSMEFLWNLIKSAIVLWRGMPDQTLTSYLNAIEFAYKKAPSDFKTEEDLELLGHVLILMSGSVKCCDQSTLVLFAESVD